MCTTSEASGVELLRLGLGQLVDTDPAALPDQHLREELAELLTAANTLHALVLSRVDAFDARRLSWADGLRTTRSWLCAFARLSQGAASALLHQARLMRALPAVAQVA